MMNIEKIYFYHACTLNPIALCDVTVVANGFRLNFLRLIYSKQRGFILILPARKFDATGAFYKYFKFPSQEDFDRVRLAVIKRYLYCRTLPGWRLSEADADITAEDIAEFSQASDFEINPPDEIELRHNAGKPTATP